MCDHRESESAREISCITFTTTTTTDITGEKSLHNNINNPPFTGAAVPDTTIE